jgi:hypothetical protein
MEIGPAGQTAPPDRLVQVTAVHFKPAEGVSVNIAPSAADGPALSNVMS